MDEEYPFVLLISSMQIKVSYKKPQVLQALRYHFISKPENQVHDDPGECFCLTGGGFICF